MQGIYAGNVMQGIYDLQNLYYHADSSIGVSASFLW